MIKFLFCNIGWMKSYRGIQDGNLDSQIIGGGSFVHKYGYGYEILNFLPEKGSYFGYVQARSDHIRIEKLGASEFDECVHGVIVVWIATHPEGGRRIVGWYKNATVYRHRQKPTMPTRRVYKDKTMGFYVRASMKDGYLLDPDRRTLIVPTGKGFMGQSNVWYADQPEASGFLTNVQNLIRNPEAQPNVVKGGRSPHQPDPFIRQKVEKNAVQVVTRHYRQLGYQVSSYEKDNVGWDLEARSGEVNSQILRLEVKGLAQRHICVDLTPNEYAQMQKFLHSYRICVVTNSLTPNPKLYIFSFSPENGAWEDRAGKQLAVNEIISARLRVKKV